MAVRVVAISLLPQDFGSSCFLMCCSVIGKFMLLMGPCPVAFLVVTVCHFGGWGIHAPFRPMTSWSPQPVRSAQLAPALDKQENRFPKICVTQILNNSPTGSHHVDVRILHKRSLSLGTALHDFTQR